MRAAKNAGASASNGKRPVFSFAEALVASSAISHSEPQAAEDSLTDPARDSNSTSDLILVGILGVVRA